MIYLATFLTLFLAFFILYLLARGDFVLLRKNVSLFFMFDLAFIVLFCAFIFGRFFYIFDSFDFGLIHFIRFFHFFKLPGLSLLGCFFGGAIGIYIGLKEKKVLSRAFDIFSLSFYPLVFLWILFGHFPVGYLLLKPFLLILAAVGFFLLLRFHKNFTLKDGSTGLLIAVSVSLISFVLNFFNPKQSVFFFLSFSQWVSIVLVIGGVGLFLRNQHHFFTKQKRK